MKKLRRITKGEAGFFKRKSDYWNQLGQEVKKPYSWRWDLPGWVYKKWFGRFKRVFVGRRVWRRLYHDADLRRIGFKVLFLVTLNLLLGVILAILIRISFEGQVSDYWRNRVNAEVSINNKIWWLIDESKQEEAQQIIDEEMTKFHQFNQLPKLK